jgi:hypothetical protein
MPDKVHKHDVDHRFPTYVEIDVHRVGYHLAQFVADFERTIADAMILDRVPTNGLKFDAPEAIAADIEDEIGHILIGELVRLDLKIGTGKETWLGSMDR